MTNALAKALDWFMDKMNELIIFLEYPIDYIVEFGDDLKQLSMGKKVLKIGKTLLMIYLSILAVFLVIFLVLLNTFLGSGSGGRSLAEGMYKDAVRQARDEAESRARTGQGSWGEYEDYAQEYDNINDR